MGQLRVELFGGLFAYSASRRVHGHFRTQKSKELFAFLVLGRDRTYPRSTLASIFWGDRPEADARNNLRRDLWDIRRFLESNRIKPDTYLTLRGDEIGFNPSADFWLDVAEFEMRCQSVEDSPGSELSREERESLERAVHLYRGDLLEGVYEDWCLYKREALRDRFLNALARLMKFHQAYREWEAATAYGKRLLGHDVLLEHIHRDLMHCYFRAGARPSALKQFAECARCLKDELDVEPMEETRALYQHILNENREAIDRICGAVPGSPTSRLQPSSDQVNRTLSDLYGARNRLHDTSAKIDQAIQDVLRLRVSR